MRPGSLAILGIAAYSVFLVATLPARWAVERAGTSGDLALHSVEGTIWNGEAQAVVGLGGGTFTVDRLAWRFLPSRLLQARLGYAISAQGAGFEAQGEAARSFSGWSVRDLKARADAALATAALPWTGPWRPEGSVSATVPSLELAGREARGNLQLEWRNAASALSEVKPLGSYRAEVAAEGAGANLRVSTLEGALRVTGQGRLEFPSRLAFTGEARAEAAKAGALQPLLDLIGPARPDGSRAIDWRTR
jgi:general secretion pathway protein N